DDVRELVVLKVDERRRVELVVEDDRVVLVAALRIRPRGLERVELRAALILPLRDLLQRLVALAVERERDEIAAALAVDVRLDPTELQVRALDLREAVAVELEELVLRGRAAAGPVLGWDARDELRAHGRDEDLPALLGQLLLRELRVA